MVGWLEVKRRELESFFTKTFLKMSRREDSLRKTMDLGYMNLRGLDGWCVRRFAEANLSTGSLAVAPPSIAADSVCGVDVDSKQAVTTAAAQPGRSSDPRRSLSSPVLKRSLGSYF